MSYVSQAYNYIKSCYNSYSTPARSQTFHYQRIGNEEERVQKLLAKALACRAVRELYEKANQTPDPYTNTPALKPWHVQFSSTIPFNGVCDIQNRNIVLRTDQSDDSALAIFVFELTNAISSKKMHNLYLQASMGAFDSEAFTKSNEELEFAGAKTHHAIIKTAIQENGWGPSLDIYKDIVPMNFERYWERIKCTPHANYYRDTFARLFPLIAFDPLIKDDLLDFIAILEAKVSMSHAVRVFTTLAATGVLTGNSLLATLATGITASIVTHITATTLFPELLE